MLMTVRNPRPESPAHDGFGNNARLLAALTVWAAALFWLAGVGPHLTGFAWYSVSFAEGVLAYDRMPDEATCQARAADGFTVCLTGAGLGYAA